MSWFLLAEEVTQSLANGIDSRLEAVHIVPHHVETRLLPSLQAATVI